MAAAFLFATLLLASLSLYISREALSGHHDLRPPPIVNSKHPTATIASLRRYVSSLHNQVYETSSSSSYLSVLFPDWEVFIVSEDSQSDDFDGYRCVFQNNATAAARFVGNMPISKWRTFKCSIPKSVKRLRPLLDPIMTKSDPHMTDWSRRPELKRWKSLVYETFSTLDDVVVFSKGVNRPGRVRNSTSLRCVFQSEIEVVKTPVTSSVQEVFRCAHPNLPEGSTAKLTLEILEQDKAEGKLVQSVAYYKPFVAVPDGLEEAKLGLCACTMVRNVAKFLKEWVVYHAGVGVEKFVLYDNGSDDDLSGVVDELRNEGYKVETVFWPWPKSQEAGFSHSALYAKAECQWMMYMDVDEFVFSPSWTRAAMPSLDMVESLLRSFGDVDDLSVGQVMIQCHDFGPSNQTEHPVKGVTQGYTCRRKLEERHKSIVLLDAVDESLQNSVHHFRIQKERYRGEKVRVEKAVVNHYKFQAWSEFKTKFNGRVSTYVADWTENTNLMSKDRTPGLGVEAVEPEGWAMQFCEVVDTRLQFLTQQWFGRRITNESGITMAWER